MNKSQMMHNYQGQLKEVDIDRNLMVWTRTEKIIIIKKFRYSIE